MILGIGTDLVEVSRVRALLARHPERALQRLFTAGEVAYCRASGHAAESFAARFAAKEALLKAVGTGWGRGIGWTEVEVVSAAGGAPTLRLHGAARRHAEARGIRRTHLSLTHTGELAAAFVILEG